MVKVYTYVRGSDVQKWTSRRQNSYSAAFNFGYNFSMRPTDRPGR